MQKYDTIKYMCMPVPKILTVLSEISPLPLYIVGGYVRNYLAEKFISDDIDLAGSIPAEEFAALSDRCGFRVLSRLSGTGTVKIAGLDINCEYTRFRIDSYRIGGRHFPDKVEFTDDIYSDALRRDFKCNAVYYDIKEKKIVDPLGGLVDIKNRALDTVRPPEEVFRYDGIRLLRLARFAAELNFTPTEGAIAGARRFAENVKSVSEKKIKDEVERIKNSCDKYPFSPPNGLSIAAEVLKKTGIYDFVCQNAQNEMTF